jgi:hypothetical protein
LKFLIENNLKRKQKYLINKSCLFSIVAILESTILNYLYNNSRLDRLCLFESSLSSRKYITSSS